MEIVSLVIYLLLKDSTNMMISFIDLVITSCAVNSTSCEKKQIEIGINKKGANNVFFEFAPAIPIPRGAGQIGFLDLGLHSCP
jgi:hypothetical protein